MVYYTGDLHGNPREVIDFCEKQKLTEQDTLILLGDVGANYGLDKRDEDVKKRLNAVKPYLMCICRFPGSLSTIPCAVTFSANMQISLSVISVANAFALWYDKSHKSGLFGDEGEPE